MLILSVFYYVSAGFVPNFVGSIQSNENIYIHHAAGTGLFLTFAQPSTSKKNTMKMNAGIVTPELEATKAFYRDVLHFGITFENEFYLLMHTPGGQSELAFLLPNHPSQQPLFRSMFPGAGLFLTIEVENVDEVYKEISGKKIPIEIELRDEPWGDRHFAIKDPNGIGIDIVTYKPAQ
jgi:catechol 2,3-dioxygenase-like lactoylglutathione lyase family enzyme